MKQYTDLIKGICKMLEVIDKSKKARQFAYTFLILAFIFGMGWIMPDFLKDLSYFILTLKNC